MRISNNYSFGYTILIFLAVFMTPPGARAETTGGEIWPAMPAIEIFDGSKILFRSENGDTVSLSSLKGKVVFINFWATWCVPCRMEMSTIRKLQKSLGDEDNIRFLMVDVDGNFDKSTKFMRNRKIYMTVYESLSQLPSEFLNRAVPTTVVLDKSGKIAIKIEGAVNFTSSKMKKAIRELIEEKL